MKLSDILNRAKEPSSYAGVAAITLGLGQLFKINEAGEIATTIGDAGAIALATGDPVLGLIALAAGVAAVFAREKGSPK